MLHGRQVETGLYPSLEELAKLRLTDAPLRALRSMSELGSVLLDPYQRTRSLPAWHVQRAIRDFMIRYERFLRAGDKYVVTMWHPLIADPETGVADPERFVRYMCENFWMDEIPLVNWVFNLERERGTVASKGFNLWLDWFGGIVFDFKNLLYVMRRMSLRGGKFLLETARTFYKVARNKKLLAKALKELGEEVIPPTVRALRLTGMKYHVGGKMMVGLGRWMKKYTPWLQVTFAVWYLLNRSLFAYAYYLAGKQRADHTYKAVKYWNRQTGQVDYWRPEGTCLVDDPADDFSPDQDTRRCAPPKGGR